MQSDAHSAHSNTSRASRGGRSRGRGGSKGRGQGQGRGGGPERTVNTRYGTPALDIPAHLLPSPSPAKRGRPALLDRMAPSTAAGFSTSAVSSSAPTPTPTSTSRPDSPADGEKRRFSEFVDRGVLHPTAVEGVPFEYATGIQSYTIEPVCAGKDILAQARTGQGKTLAALIPSLSRLLHSPPPPSSPSSPSRISVLVISPTRELTIQIALSATSLLAPTPYEVQYVVGGRSMEKETKALREGRADFLVATPGRLADHIRNGVLGEREMLKGLRILVLDECDRLLDQGFRPEINKIIAHLNAVSGTKDRQTLLFSATVPPEVKQVIAMTLKKDYVTVSTVSSQDSQTHEHVPQFLLQVELADLMPTILAVLQREIAQDGDNCKVMVFLPTARAVGLLHDVIESLSPKLSKPVWEINSRMSQSARSKAAEQFKDAKKGGILISSDVTARGMDFPGVTAVIQAGLPSSPEQYIHRLGRTARAGADGRGILILSPFEKFFLRKGPMQTMPLQPYPIEDLAPLQATCRDQIDSALEKVDDKVKAQAYSAWLGFYKSSLGSIKWTTDELVRQVNDYARILKYVGEEKDHGLPPIPKSTIGKMQLKGVKGLNVVPDPPRVNRPGPRR